MPCDPSELKDIPIFALLGAEERAVLAEYVELRRFGAHHRIYRIGDPGAKAYLALRGKVQVAMIDDDSQEVVIHTPGPGDIFGLSSMLADSPHQTTAQTLEATTTVEIDRDHLAALIMRRPMAGLDMLTVVSRQLRAAHDLVRTRTARNPNEVIAEQLTVGDRIADDVAHFGGSWKFIISFGVVLTAYVAVNVWLATRSWDPYPFILLNLFLSLLAAVQAPVIMMSQNRQDTKDRVRSELDFSVNRKAEMEITQLAAKLHRIEDRVDEIHEELVRG